MNTAQINTSSVINNTDDDALIQSESRGPMTLEELGSASTSTSVKKQRKCGNPSCSQVGHTIRNCSHPSVFELRERAKRIANYSIGYDYPEFLRKWLRTVSKPMLCVLGSYSTLRIGVSIQNLFDNFYTNVLATPVGSLSGEALIEHHRLTARESLPSVEIVTQLRTRMLELGLILRLPPREQAMENLRIVSARLASADMQVRVNHQSLLNLRRDYEDSRRRHTELLHSTTVAQEAMDAFDPPPQRKFSNIVILNQVDENMEETKEEENEDCPICFDELPKNVNSVILNCSHKYCNPCMVKYFTTISASAQPKCAKCRAEVCSLSFSCIIQKEEFMDTFIEDGINTSLNFEEEV